MVIYLLYYFSVLFFGLMSDSGNTLFEKRRSKAIYCIVLGFALILIVGLRHPSMGADLNYGGSNGYLGMFKKIGSSDWKAVFTNDFLNYERGYVILNKILSLIGNHYNILLFAAAVASIAPIFYIIYKYSKDAAFSVIVYMGLTCFLICFSGLRQAIAIGITTFSVKFIIQKKPVKFLIMIFIATLFHYTAFIFALAYILYNIKLNNVTKIISVFIIPIVYLFKVPLFILLSNFFKDEVKTEETGSFMLFFVFTLIYIFMLIIPIKECSIASGMRNIFYFACICQVFGGVHTTAMRVGYYFMVALVIAMPNAVNEYETPTGKEVPKTDRIAFSLIIIFCFTVFGLYLIKSSENSWAMASPYRFFWQ